MSDKNFEGYDETQLETPEEHYFSRSKNQWLLVSDMSDMHVRRAFKRLLRMIRLGTLVELEKVNKHSFTKINIQNEADAISKHAHNIHKITNAEDN